MRLPRVCFTMSMNGICMEIKMAIIIVDKIYHNIKKNMWHTIYAVEWLFHIVNTPITTAHNCSQTFQYRPLHCSPQYLYQ